jgi:hypothetical protein
MRLRVLLLITLSLVGAPALAGAATILTFDQAGGVSNGVAINQTYGDNVAALVQSGHTYGTDGFGFTPNVTVHYGNPADPSTDPSLWTTGYGSLVNVLFEHHDRFDLVLTFTADPGYNVVLHSFDLGSFPANSTRNCSTCGITISDPSTATTLYSQSGLTVGPPFASFSFSGGLQGQQVRLFFELSGLGGASDDIGIDNIKFGQVALQQPPQPVPEPALALLLGVGLAGSLFGQAARERLKAEGRNISRHRPASARGRARDSRGAPPIPVLTADTLAAWRGLSGVVPTPVRS